MISAFLLGLHMAPRQMAMPVPSPCPHLGKALTARASGCLDPHMGQALPWGACLALPVLHAPPSAQHLPVGLEQTLLCCLKLSGPRCPAWSGQMGMDHPQSKHLLPRGCRP